MSEAEFEQLSRAQALASLQPAERDRLDELAAGDPLRTRQVAAMDAVLRALAMERELGADVTRVGEPGEDASATLRRLNSVAAEAEQELRARLMHRPPVTFGADRRGSVAFEPGPAGIVTLRRRLGLLCLAAAAVLALWYGFGTGGRIDTRPPADLRAGQRLQLVLLQPMLTATSRTISWAAVSGASGYHADILDRDGRVVLHRDDGQLKSTAWDLTRDEYDALLPNRPLRLRVTALDGLSLPIGSSGDLELTVLPR
ncbi:MAG: hypothetical protein KDC98_16250 [Planctomycetes bacterium]|nr:hypothetical protein [Planctomycetota bacterium]